MAGKWENYKFTHGDRVHVSKQWCHNDYYNAIGTIISRIPEHEMPRYEIVFKINDRKFYDVMPEDALHLAV